MSKTRVAIVCGGRSSEHEISCASASGILGAIDRERFEVIAIGITRTGKWVLLDSDSSFSLEAGRLPEIDPNLPRITADIHGFAVNGHPLNIDLLFPVLHGPYGEDGTIQGFCEMAGVRYVGSGVLASAVSMDKSFSKSIFRAHGLKVAHGPVLVKGEWSAAQLEDLQYPIFVKPARSGSSRGTTKVKSADQLITAIDYAFQFDTKVLVEEAIVGREIECAVLEVAGHVEASPVGEIKILGKYEFYDFEAKYLDDATEVVFPEDLPAGVEAEIQRLAISAFRAVGCEGLARVDFFYSTQGEIIINEINTMPGFTATSMYPKLWTRGGRSYKELISALIDSALLRSPDITR